jgi:hypothetical protein
MQNYSGHAASVLALQCGLPGLGETEDSYAHDAARWAREAKGVDLDPWQARVLGNETDNQLLCCSRQAGKSTVVSIAAAHCAVYRPKSLILCLSPTDRQSGELFLKASALLQGELKESNSKTAISLTNGSRILSLPGSADTIRGFSPTLAIIDEAGFADDDLFAAVAPMLAVSKGRLICLSSANGRRGFFYKLCTNLESGYVFEKVVAEDCPRISLEFLEQQRAVLSPAMFEQEYHCVFGDAENAAFTGLENIFSEEVEIL